MTSGERMVWAAAFVGALEVRCDSVHAAGCAARAVRMLGMARDAASGEIDDTALAMLDDMLGQGEDRTPTRPVRTGYRDGEGFYHPSPDTPGYQQHCNICDRCALEAR